MARYLTGIQSSGTPHLGNVLGAMLPAIEFSKHIDHECFFFIADLHALTSIKDPDDREHFTQAIAAVWLALGFDVKKNCLYRQSRIPEVCELAWYLNCLTPYPMLANAHSFKDKSSKLADINAGLFTYPVLMAADIILYDADYTPVGKDQRQHLEMTRDIVRAFHAKFGETFVIPKEKINDTLSAIPGTDGQKMSKSYHNTIDIFLPAEKLKKQVFAIVTDNISLSDPKNPDQDNVFSLYSAVADADDIEVMRKHYQQGGYGYGQAKQELYDLIINKFGEAREKYHHYMTYPNILEEKMMEGEKKARQVATKVLQRVRKKLKYR